MEGLKQVVKYCTGLLAVFAAAIAALWMFLAITTSIAFGFPENVRMNYPACGACHVAGAAGGGVTTAYGRGAGAEFMTTWAQRNEELPMGIFRLPDWIAVGGDMRYININARTDDGQTIHRKFWMQYDGELAVKPIPQLTFAATYGQYGGPDQEPQLRRHYVKLDVGPYVAFRAGKFVATHGINTPDHTLPTRSALGFGQGSETYNIEGALSSRWGEAIVTGVYGQQGALTLNDDKGYGIATDDRRGVVAKAAAFIGKSAQLGLTGQHRFNETSDIKSAGVYTLWGITSYLYLMGEYDHAVEDGEQFDVAAGTLGWTWRGLHVALIGDNKDRRVAYGAQVRWLPRPHWEFSAEAKRTTEEGRYVDGSVLMLHYYL